MGRRITRFFYWLQEQFYRPLRILWVCVGLAFINLAIDGSLVRLWQLHKDFQEIQLKTKSLEGKSAEMDEKIRRASDPLFIEREARDRFDLVGQGDLVFVFADDEGQEEE